MASASFAGLSLHRKVIVKPLIINTVVTSFQGGRPHSRRRSGTSWVSDDAICNFICSREKVVAEETHAILITWNWPQTGQTGQNMIHI